MISGEDNEVEKAFSHTQLRERDGTNRVAFEARTLKQVVGVVVRSVKERRSGIRKSGELW